MTRNPIPPAEHVPFASPFMGRACAHPNYKALTLIILIGLSARLYWMVTKAPIISNEGAEYVRMAENLLHGKGLVGVFEGPETMYAPLLSVLTAGLTVLTRNAELAAHLICLVFGAALIIPVFFIALHMYGVRVAYLSAVLVGFHPFLIALSGSIYNEDVYITLLVAGVYFGMRALESRRIRDYVLLSLCLSFAYLSRPEAIAYLWFFILAVWISVIVARTHVRRAALGSALIIGTFLLVASPYIRFLYVHTGGLRWEGKWNLNYSIAYRFRSGMSFTEAAYGLAPDATSAGPQMEPFRFAAYSPYPHSLADKLQTLWAMAKLNWQDETHFVRDRALGGPLVLALALLGLFRKSWSRRRLFHEAIIICMVISIVFLGVTNCEVQIRHVFVLAAFWSLWAAKGIDEVGKWTRSLMCSLKAGFLPGAKTMGLVVEAGLVVAVLALALDATGRDSGVNTEQSRFAYVKQACLWLKDYSPGPKRIACVGAIPTYYAQGTLIALPYAGSDQALRYLDSKNVDFIVLDSHYVSNFPELSEWMKHGIPDNRVQLIHEAGIDAYNRVAVYRWVRPSFTH